MSKRIIVTGGAGFIGSHLVDSLVALDYQVLVIDNLSTGHQEFINQQAKFEKVDVTDQKLAKVVASFKPDLIYHLAAQKNVRTSLENPVFDAQVNVLGSLNVLQAALENKVSKFIFISTGGIYGDTANLPTNEQGAEQPLSPYILNKLTFEKYLAILAKDKLEYVILRPANVYGPRQDPHGEAGVISIFINQALADQVLKINGDGQQTRDFVYVADVVQACLKALTAKPDIYNIGTGQETSLLNLIAAIKVVVKKEIKTKHQAAIIGEVQRSVLDASKAQAKLNWQPEYDLSKGLDLTCKYFSN